MLDLTADELADLRTLDEIVLEEIIQRKSVQPYLLEDDSQVPLAQWWWHLGKLRDSTYPASLLPLYLRPLYAANHAIA